MGRQANLLVSMLYAAKYLLLLLTDEPAPCATGEANERTCKADTVAAGTLFKNRPCME